MMKETVNLQSVLLFRWAAASSYIFDTVPNVKRKEVAWHVRFGTQIFVLQGHG